MKKNSSDSDDGLIEVLQDGTIVIAGEINFEVAHTFISAIEMLKTQGSPRTIVITICSDGGDIDAGGGIIDAIHDAQREGFKVTTKGYGVVASMAALIFLTGDARLMGPTCSLMIHDGSADFGPQDYSTLEHEMDNWKRLNEYYNLMVANVAGISVDEVKKLFGRYLSAEECLKLGLITCTL